MLSANQTAVNDSPRWSNPTTPLRGGNPTTPCLYQDTCTRTDVYPDSSTHTQCSDDYLNTLRLYQTFCSLLYSVFPITSSLAVNISVEWCVIMYLLYFSRLDPGKFESRQQVYRRKQTDAKWQTDCSVISWSYVYRSAIPITCSMLLGVAYYLKRAGTLALTKSEYVHYYIIGLPLDIVQNIPYFSRVLSKIVYLTSEI